MPMVNPPRNQRMRAILLWVSEWRKIHHRSNGAHTTIYERVSTLNPSNRPASATNQGEEAGDSRATITQAPNRNSAASGQILTIGNQAKMKVLEAYKITAAKPATHFRVSWQTCSQMSSPRMAVSVAERLRAENHDIPNSFIQMPYT